MLLYYFKQSLFGTSNCENAKHIFFFFLFWLIWTLIEYLFHRFILHRSKFTKYIHDNKHHANVKFKPSEIPFFVGSILIILGSIFYIQSFPMLGFGTGMLVYVALHHVNHKYKSFIYLKEHHKYHHLVSTKFNYGISTNFWDFVFGTLKNGTYKYDEKKNNIYFE